jgi:RNA polymerase sigma factor (sigma-70 family)
MDNILNNNFEEYWKSSDVQNIMNKVANRYRKSIDMDDIESIKMQTLWRCIDKYDETRGTKFTSYLYQQITFAFKNKLKKKRMEFNNDSIEKQDTNTGNKMEVFDILTGLEPELRDVIDKRFYHNMTMVEIGKSNGYSRETARRRLKKALKICRKTCIA